MRFVGQDGVLEGISTWSISPTKNFLRGEPREVCDVLTLLFKKRSCGISTLQTENSLGLIFGRLLQNVSLIDSCFLEDGRSFFHLSDRNVGIEYALTTSQLYWILLRLSRDQLHSVLRICGWDTQHLNQTARYGGTRWWFRGGRDTE